MSQTTPIIVPVYYPFVFVSRGYEKQSILEIHARSRQRKGISFLETLGAFIIRRRINTRGIVKKGKDSVVRRWSQAVGEIFLSSTFVVCWWRLSSARGTVENRQPRWIKLPTLLSERKRMPLIKFLDTGARRNARVEPRRVSESSLTLPRFHRCCGGEPHRGEDTPRKFQRSVQERNREGREEDTTGGEETHRLIDAKFMTRLRATSLIRQFQTTTRTIVGSIAGSTSRDSAFEETCALARKRTIIVVE